MSPRVLVTTDAAGGVWHYATALGRRLSRDGAVVHLAVVGDAPAAAELEAAAGLSFEVLGVPYDWEAGSAHGLAEGRRAITNAASRFGADIIHLNEPAYGGAFPQAVVAVAHSCVTTWWRETRGGEPRDDWRWHRDGMEEGLASADAAVAPSAAFAALLDRTYDLPQRPWAIHNGTEKPRRAAAPKGPFVMAAGRAWDESKNFALLDAVAPHIGWTVALAGACMPPGGAAAVNFPNLKCLGALPRSAMDRLYADAAVFVSPSLYEPFGLAALEAADAANALVLADIPTYRELWWDAAVFFDPRDADDLRLKLRQVTTDDVLRHRVAAAANERARSLSLDRTARRMGHLFRDVLQRKPLDTPA